MNAGHATSPPRSPAPGSLAVVASPERMGRRCAGLPANRKAFSIKRCATGAHRRRFVPLVSTSWTNTAVEAEFVGNGPSGPDPRTALPDAADPTPPSPWSTRRPPKPQRSGPHSIGAGHKRWISQARKKMRRRFKRLVGKRILRQDNDGEGYSIHGDERSLPNAGAGRRGGKQIQLNYERLVGLEDGYDFSSNCPSCRSKAPVEPRN